MSKLFSQMEAVSHRFEELSVRLNQPETAADPARFRRLMQEYRELEPVVEAYRSLTTARDHLAQAKALHDELEAVYNPHVDFSRVYALANAHALRLFKEI